MKQDGNTWLIFHHSWTETLPQNQFLSSMKFGKKKRKYEKTKYVEKKRRYKQTGTVRNTSLKTTYGTRYQSSHKFEVFSRVHWYGQIGGWIPTDQVFCSINLITASVMSEGEFKWWRQVQIELVIVSYSSKRHYLYDISSRKYVVVTRSIPIGPDTHFFWKNIADISASIVNR